MPDSKSTPVALVIGLQALLVVVMLHASWQAPFYDVDDKHHVRMATGTPVMDLFNPTRVEHFIPLTLVSYLLDDALFGPGPSEPRAESASSAEKSTAKNWAPAIRIMNGVYHLIAGVLLYFFLCRLGAGNNLAAVVALIWTGHPMACESVCWIAERKNVLAAMFGFGALLAWTAPRERLWRWPAVWMLYGLAVLSKPAALGLLPVLAVLEIVDPLNRDFSWRSGRHWLRVAGRLSIPILLSLSVAIVTVYVYQQDIVVPPGGSVWTALLTDTEIFSRYLFNLLFPNNLSFYYYVEPVVSLLDFRLWLYGALLLIFSGGIYKLSEPARRPLAIFGILWFFVALAPNANIISTAFPMQDRFVYLAAPGLFLSLALALDSLLRKLPDGELWPRRAAMAYLAAILLLLAVRSQIFSSSDRLELDAAERQPRSGRARLIATEICQVAYQRHSPKGAQPDAGLAALYSKKALEHYAGAFAAPDIEYFMDRLRLRTSHANLLMQLGRYAEAREVLDGWLPPPPEIPILRDKDERGQKIVRRRGEAQRGYRPEVLAIAWRLSAELFLHETYAQNDSGEQRIASAQKALKHADESLKVHVCDYEAAVVRGRILIRLSDLFLMSKDLPAARNHFDEGVAQFKRVPEKSGSSRLAKKLAATVKAPPEKLD